MSMTLPDYFAQIHQKDLNDRFEEWSRLVRPHLGRKPKGAFLHEDFKVLTDGRFVVFEAAWTVKDANGNQRPAPGTLVARTKHHFVPAEFPNSPAFRAPLVRK
jgi:hypothetical protein